jgi:hypothetical protein
MDRWHLAIGLIDREIVVAVQAEAVDFAYAGKDGLFRPPALLRRR